MKRPSQTILVVDDEISVLRTVSSILKRGGYRVLVAGNSETALAHGSMDPDIEPIHLLLCDVRLADGKTGTEVARQIQKWRPEIRVILMSGYTGMVLDMNAGWHFIGKPFKSDALLETVRRELSEPAVVRSASGR